MNGNLSFFKIFTRTGDKLLENCDFIIGHGTSFLKLSVAQIKLHDIRKLYKARNDSLICIDCQ